MDMEASMQSDINEEASLIWSVNLWVTVILLILEKKATCPLKYA